MKKSPGVIRFRIGVFLFLSLFPGAVPGPLPAQDLRLGPGDMRIFQGIDAGYHLIVRKKPGVGSVMLVESTEDPARKTASYSLRNPVFHPVNGNEQRILDGKILDTNNGYHIVDSSVETDPEFGEAFHLFIPWVATYGYPWARSGEIMILDGTYLNVRTFVLPLCDYTGPYLDNPFTVRATQKPLDGPPEGNFMPEAVTAFRGISERGKGEALYSTGERDVAEKIRQVLAGADGDTLDLVLAIDTTDSMENDMPFLKQQLPALVDMYVSKFRQFRIGIVYYRDYFDEYLNRLIPFETTTRKFSESFNRVQVRGGRDIPEAVYEALYAGVTGFPWEAETRVLILVGDAPPHPKPRGKITEEMVFREAGLRDVRVHAIILPQ